MAILDGRALAKSMRDKIKTKVSSMKTPPGLAVVRVGDDPASKIYVNNKHKACREVGINSQIIVLDESIEQKELVKTIKKLSKDKSTHGILIQLPLPAHINEEEILTLIPPEKDVDGFHPINVGRLVSGNAKLVSATPKGIIKLIESVTEIEGKNAVVIGRSNIVGKPVSILLLHRSATVTICHSKTNDLVEECKRADILIAAVGSPNIINKDMVKRGAIVIDVGINRIDDDSDKGYHLQGDVDFDNLKDIASHITPVPGGVGPMTIAMLLENCLIAKELQQQQKRTHSK